MLAHSARFRSPANGTKRMFSPPSTSSSPRSKETKTSSVSEEDEEEKVNDFDNRSALEAFGGEYDHLDSVNAAEEKDKEHIASKVRLGKVVKRAADFIDGEDTFEDVPTIPVLQSASEVPKNIEEKVEDLTPPPERFMLKVPQEARRRRQVSVDSDWDKLETQVDEIKLDSAPADTLEQKKASPSKRRKERNESSKSSRRSRRSSKRSKEKKKSAPEFMDISKVPYVRDDLYRFVRSPLKETPGTTCRCFIERERAAGRLSRYPTYKFYLEDPYRRKSARLLMFAQKKMSMSSNHIFSCEYDDLDKFMEERSKFYLGKLRGSGGQYILYDKGMNPKNLAWQEAANNPSVLREELAVVVYNRSKRCDATRQMEVGIPISDDSGNFVKKWRPFEECDSMAPAFKRVRFRGAQNADKGGSIFCLNNHASRFDALSACLAEYNRRATVASCKNFQLHMSPPEDTFLMEQYECGVKKRGWGGKAQSSGKRPRPLLQMGKIADNVFTVDVQAPLSLFQAFGICVSRIDTAKIPYRRSEE